MTTDLIASQKRARLAFANVSPLAPLAVALLVVTVPTVVSLGKQAWSTDAGAHGPIVLATGLWLLHHNGLQLKGAPAGRWTYAAGALAPSLALYAFGRAYDFISLEMAGLYGVMVSFIWRMVGTAGLRRHFFPLVYLAFLVPLPGWLVDRLTAPLQHLVSRAAAAITSMLGYPVARHGITLEVAQYKLLVEDACAGMNSLVGLIAISLFYIYLVRRASWAYAVLLILLIVPVAIAVNLLRVVSLILVTYYWGDEAAQGFLHATTGMVLFGLGLMFILALDFLFSRLVRRPH